VTKGHDPHLPPPRVTASPRHPRDYKGTLDYILYTRDSLQPRALLELPSEAEVGARPGEGLPNANWSSDHISLMCEFSVVGA
jgi:mRNA deadenylase 3'-5' endonuclease subunit Ccr4